MKSSFYNLYFKYDGEFEVIYNSFTGAIIKIENEKKSWIENEQFEEFSVEEIIALKDHGIIIDDDIDEKKIIEMDRISGSTSKDSLTYRILTTTECNAKCFYCFEEGMDYCKMSMDTAKAVSNFISTRSLGAKKIQIQWFGGEPLMNAEVISAITNDVYAFAYRNNIQYDFTMVSNAILFDEMLVEKAKKEWYLRKIQITLDGEKGEYEKRKRVSDSFDRVIENIRLLANAGIQVSIRLNYDKYNFKSVLGLIELLSSMKLDNVHMYPYPLFGTYSSESSKNKTGKEELLKLYEVLYKNGLMPNNRLPFKYRNNQCFATALNSFVIYPDGKLFKCAEDITKSVGDVWSGVRLNDAYYKWCSFSIEEKCENCKFLPICQGGCKAGHLGIGKVKCFLQKDVVDNLVLAFVKHYEME